MSANIPAGIHWDLDDEAARYIVFDQATENFSWARSLHQALLHAHRKRLLLLVNGEVYVDEDPDGTRYLISASGAWKI